MKKYHNILISLLLILVVLLGSCKKDKTEIEIILPKVTKTFSGQNAPVLITLKPDMVNGGELGELKIYDNSGNSWDTTLVGEQTKTILYKYNSASVANDADVELTVEATDSKSGIVTTATTVLKIEVITAEVIMDIHSSYYNNDPANPGDFLQWDISLIAQTSEHGKLGSFTIKEGSTVLFSKDYSDYYYYNYDYINFYYDVPDDAIAGSTITLTCEAIDANSGLSTTEDIIINISDALPLEEWSGTLTYTSTDLNNHFMLACKSDGAITVNGNSNEGDIAFNYQVNYGNNIVSPNADWTEILYSYNNITYTANDKKETKIQFYSGYTDWENINADFFQDININTSTVIGGGNGVQGVEQGDIILFEMEDGRKGAIKVLYTDYKITTNMQIAVKYQTETNK